MERLLSESFTHSRVVHSATPEIRRRPSTARNTARYAAAQCIVIGPVCLQRTGWVCGWVCLWVCYHDNSKLRASIHTKLGLLVKVVQAASWFGRINDHLQLIKFWPSCAPGKGVCGETNFFDSALLKPARSVYVSMSAFSLNCALELLIHKFRCQ